VRCYAHLVANEKGGMKVLTNERLKLERRIVHRRPFFKTGHLQFCQERLLPAQYFAQFPGPVRQYLLSLLHGVALKTVALAIVHLPDGVRNGRFRHGQAGLEFGFEAFVLREQRLVERFERRLAFLLLEALQSPEAAAHLEHEASRRRCQQAFDQLYG